MKTLLFCGWVCSTVTHDYGTLDGKSGLLLSALLPLITCITRITRITRTIRLPLRVVLRARDKPNADVRHKIPGIADSDEHKQQQRPSRGSHDDREVLPCGKRYHSSLVRE